MEQVKTHISGWFFLYLVPCSLVHSCIFVLLSWGFLASDREVYKRPGEDATTAEVSRDTTQRGHLILSRTSLSSVLQEAEPLNSTGGVRQPKSPSAFVIRPPS